MRPRIVFWYEFASSYSYLSAMRVDDEAARVQVAVDWKPFLLGPIFKSQGWETSPFNIYPAKGRYMARDIARIAAARGLPFKMPAVFPGNGLKAARLAIAARNHGALPAFSRAVFSAGFGKGLDIFDDAVLTDCLAAAGLDADVTRSLAKYGGIKFELRANTEQAQAHRDFRSTELYHRRRRAVLGRRPPRSGPTVGDGSAPQMRTQCAFANILSAIT